MSGSSRRTGPPPSLGAGRAGGNRRRSERTADGQRTGRNGREGGEAERKGRGRSIMVSRVRCSAEEAEMIIRIWEAQVAPHRAEDFCARLASTVLPSLGQWDGFLGGELLRACSAEDHRVQM